jgi:hypothetical protein
VDDGELLGEWLRKHPDQTEEERLEFVHVILKDIKVCNASAEQWRHVQKDHPGTRHEEFKAWEETLWTKWLSEKMKSVKRKEERKKKKQAAPSPQPPSSEGGRIMTTPPQATATPSSLTMSTLSIKTPSVSRKLASLDPDSSFKEDDMVDSSPLTARGPCTSF